MFTSAQKVFSRRKNRFFFEILQKSYRKGRNSSLSMEILAEYSKILNSKLKIIQEGIQNFTIFAVKKWKKDFCVCT